MGNPSKGGDSCSSYLLGDQEGERVMLEESEEAIRKRRKADRGREALILLFFFLKSRGEAEAF